MAPPTIGTVNSKAGVYDWFGAPHNHTHNGNLLLLVATTSYSDTQSIQTVTWNGSSMTKLDSNYSSRQGPEIWYLVTSSTANGAFAYTFTDNMVGLLCSLSVQDADTGNPFGTVVKNNGGATNPTTTLTGGADTLLLDIVMAKDTGSGLGTRTVGSGQTERANRISGTGGIHGCGLVSTEPQGTNVVMDWTLGTAPSSWRSLALPLNGVGSGGGGGRLVGGSLVQEWFTRGLLAG